MTTTTHAIIYSLVVCALGAALEGLFAGGGIKICFAVLYRLFLLPPAPVRSAAFTLLGAIMFINALWNYFFFRTGNLFHAYLLGFPYGAIAISLFLLLFLQVDRMAAWCLFPYVLYLFYAGILGYRLWKLNPPG